MQPESYNLSLICYSASVKLFVIRYLLQIYFEAAWHSWLVDELLNKRLQVLCSHWILILVVIKEKHNTKFLSGAICVKNGT